MKNGCIVLRTVSGMVNSTSKLAVPMMVLMMMMMVLMMMMMMLMVSGVYVYAR